MTDEYSLYRILSGKISLNYNDKTYVVEPPSFDILCQASLLYDKSYRDAVLLGASTQEQLLSRMLMHGLWSVDDQSTLDNLPQQIEDAKANLYLEHAALRTVSADRHRTALKSLESKLDSLLKKKNRYSMLSAEGIADFHKSCFLICSGCGIDYSKSANLNVLYYAYLRCLASGSQIRGLSRMYEWQQYWASIKLGNNIFNPILTQEQHTLIGWSRFYDNIYESAECPPQAIIDDNDLLDGWCIVQRRKRSEDEGKKVAQSFGNGGEIFISAEDSSHAQRINELNDARSKLLRQQQQNIIQQRGTIQAQDMPDVKMELRQQATQALRDHVKGK